MIYSPDHNSPGAKHFFQDLCQICVRSVSDLDIFVSERSYTTSAVKTSMLDMPVPGSF